LLKETTEALDAMNGFIPGVVKRFVSASNSLLTILMIIKYSKMFVDKYAIYTLSLVIFVYFNALHIKQLLLQCTDDGAGHLID